MSRKRITYIHVFIWMFAIFANLPYTDFRRDLPAQQIVSYIFAFLYLMLVFYLFYLYFTPKFLDRKKLTGFFSFSFIAVLIMPFFGYTVLFLIRALFEGNFQHFYNGYSFRMHMSGYFPVMTAAVFGSFFRVIINWFITMGQKAELDKEKIAVELELLKSKLNPHFLFNTLNNIDSLIRQDPEKASSELIRLSDMMRYLTYETSSDRVELQREVEYIGNFIELNRIRINSHEAISFDVSGDMETRMAPALFMPLIENAFKFANFRIHNPAIQISLSSDEGIIIFKIANFYDRRERKESSYSGLGISNLRKRLSLIYKDKQELIIKDDGTIYTVELTINTNAN